MNKSKLKNYAPKARREFIQAVTDRAHFYGLSKDKTESVKVDGDFAIINGQAFPKAIADQRDKLEDRITASTFEQVMEEIAYTWFNRFVAIRYMELHGYLSHGYRVLSNPDPDNSMPEILEKAQHVQLQGLNKEKVLELKMDGTKDEELYRMLLIAQCNELFRWMPFLFENIRDCTEVLLPDNLLHSDSLIRKLVDEIDEDDWQEVEIIGWLYQFYISEKKDQVIGKVVKSEDIPAATQLFTPNWIVKYLVQNSLGAQWMRTYPKSPLKEKMEYYIEPAEQTEEVQKQLAKITPDSLNPEELTLLDPACGSGHILVEAYDLLKEIYLDRGYRRRDIPELILNKNLYGLEIDDRAAQMAGFAVMMKARADDRRLFEKSIVPNVVSIQESKSLDVEDIVRAINEPLTSKDVSDAPRSMEELQDSIEVPLFVRSKPASATALDAEEKLTVDDLKALLGLFEHGKTFGSLIRIPEKLAEKLPAMAKRINKAYHSDKLSAHSAAKKILSFVRQALIMSREYGIVSTNPPYMGSKFFNLQLKSYVNGYFSQAKADLYACFMLRNFLFAKQSGYISMITIPNWMFLSSFMGLRDYFFENATFDTFVHNGRGVWGSDFGSCSFVYIKAVVDQYQAVYKRLFDVQGSVASVEELRERYFVNSPYVASAASFKQIPGKPVAYWISDRIRGLFQQNRALTDVSFSKFGMSTGDSSLIRSWPEVPWNRIGFGCKDSKQFHGAEIVWAPYDKGGPFRKWYGNRSELVFWKNDGHHIRNNGKSAVRNSAFFCKEHISWTLVSASCFSVRYFEEGFLLDTASNAVYEANSDYELRILMAFLNTHLVFDILNFLNPTINFSCGVIGLLPVKPVRHPIRGELLAIADDAVVISKKDWDTFETSWDFGTSPLLKEQTSSLLKSFQGYRLWSRSVTAKMKDLEENNNRLFIEAYELQDELTPEVSEEQVTLFANPKYHYGVNLSEEELEKRFKENTVKELLSYSVGCMMGRYSLDEPGLKYANSGNDGFEPKRYQKYSADDDGIIPITDQYWFNDDAAERFFKFVETVWPKETLEENLDFVAESIGRKSRETSRDAIRRYFVTGFFKDHLKTYKKRPIYWLFSSGKEKALQCLVYLHRYNEGTISRMRTEYLIPLQGRIASKIDSLKKDMEHTSSTSAANKIRKEITKLGKQAEELRKYDEKLRHYADMKIKLDLDDGVKVNYDKFGDLLAEVKKVTGTKA